MPANVEGPHGATEGLLNAVCLAAHLGSVYSPTDKILEMSALGKGTVYIVTIGFCRERNVRK